MNLFHQLPDDIQKELDPQLKKLEEKEEYKKMYDLLMDQWDKFPEEFHIELGNDLTKVGL